MQQFASKFHLLSCKLNLYLNFLPNLHHWLANLSSNYELYSFYCYSHIQRQLEHNLLSTCEYRKEFCALCRWLAHDPYCQPLGQWADYHGVHWENYNTICNSEKERPKVRWQPLSSGYFWCVQRPMYWWCFQVTRREQYSVCNST